MKRATIIKGVASAFACALLSTMLFAGASFKDTPVASASFIGNPLTGCGTRDVTMQSTVKNSIGQRLFYVKMTREFDWCRDLHCEFFRITPCYWGAARITGSVFGKPHMAGVTNLAIGWTLVPDTLTTAWKHHVEGGDWGPRSELDTYAEFHLKQCFGVGPVSVCGTRRTYSWKMAVDGSSQAHVNFKWGG